MALREPNAEVQAIVFWNPRQRTVYSLGELACGFPASAIASEPKSAALILLRLLA